MNNKTQILWLSVIGFIAAISFQNCSKFSAISSSAEPAVLLQASSSATVPNQNNPNATSSGTSPTALKEIAPTFLLEKSGMMLPEVCYTNDYNFMLAGVSLGQHPALCLAASEAGVGCDPSVNFSAFTDASSIGYVENNGAIVRMNAGSAMRQVVTPEILPKVFSVHLLLKKDSGLVFIGKVGSFRMIDCTPHGSFTLAAPPDLAGNYSSVQSFADRAAAINFDHCIILNNVQIRDGFGPCLSLSVQGLVTSTPAAPMPIPASIQQSTPSQQQTSSAPTGGSCASSPAFGSSGNDADWNMQTWSTSVVWPGLGEKIAIGDSGTAIRFTASAGGGNGITSAGVIIDFQQVSGSIEAVISACPHDFSNPVVGSASDSQPCYQGYAGNVGNQRYLTFNGVRPHTYDCSLQSNQVYYINFRASTTPRGQVSSRFVVGPR